MRFVTAIFLFGILCGFHATAADTSEPLSQDTAAAIESAIAYIAAHQQADGRVQNGNALANSEQATHEALLALALVGELEAIDVARAQALLEQASPHPTEYLSRKTEALSVISQAMPDLQQLLERQNLNGGLGAFAGEASAVLDTAYALRVLARTGDSNSAAASAVQFLMERASENGWSNQNGTTQYELSLHAWHALFPFRNVYAGVDQLLSSIRSNLFAAGASRDEDDLEARRILALLVQSQDRDEYNVELEAFLNRQLPNGSWSDDVYTTALALHVLHGATRPVVNPDLGSIVGNVLDGLTSEPLSGVSVSLIGVKDDTYLTGEEGDFRFSDLPAGQYSIEITVVGYGGFVAQLDVAPGVPLDLGAIPLNPISAPGSAIVEGTITRADTGAPLSGARVSVGALSAVTASDGKYRISDVPLGETIITATRTSFAGASAAVNVTPGTKIVFSPALNFSNQAPQVAGYVRDADTGDLLAASIVMTGANTRSVSAPNGSFTVTGLNTGTTTIRATANGYRAAEATIDLEASGTYWFSPYLLPEEGGASVLQGIVQNAVTNKPHTWGSGRDRRRKRGHGSNRFQRQLPLLGSRSWRHGNCRFSILLQRDH